MLQNFSALLKSFKVIFLFLYIPLKRNYMICSGSSNSVLSFLIVGALIILSACSTSSEEIPDAPEFPDFSEASTIDKQSTVISARSEADTDQTAYITAMDQLSIVLRELTLSTSLPGTVFQQAGETAPDFNNGSYEWIIDENSQDFSLSSSYKITANVINDLVSEWSVSIHFDSDFTSEIGSPLIESLDILRGNYDGNPFKGKWDVLTTSGFGTSLPDRQIDKQSSLVRSTSPELSVLTWDITSEAEKEFQIQGSSPIAEFYIYFSIEENVWSAEYETESDNVAIEWNRYSGEGFIVYNGEKNCWDSAGQNANC